MVVVYKIRLEFRYFGSFDRMVREDRATFKLDGRNVRIHWTALADESSDWGCNRSVWKQENK